MMAKYRLINGNNPRIFISEEGAKIIWAAYEKLFGKHCQTMERREERGGVAHLSELEYFKREGALANDFDYTKYVIP
jgi:hypothetical protein